MYKKKTAIYTGGGDYLRADGPFEGKMITENQIQGKRGKFDSSYT
jgi:hypothetical protein